MCVRAREKVSFRILKVTFSDEKVSFRILKVSFRILKVTFSDEKVSFRRLKVSFSEPSSSPPAREGSGVGFQVCRVRRVGVFFQLGSIREGGTICYYLQSACCVFWRPMALSVSDLS